MYGMMSSPWGGSFGSPYGGGFGSPYGGGGMQPGGFGGYGMQMRQQQPGGYGIGNTMMPQNRWQNAMQGNQMQNQQNEMQNRWNQNRGMPMNRMQSMAQQLGNQMQTPWDNRGQWQGGGFSSDVENSTFGNITPLTPQQEQHLNAQNGRGGMGVSGPGVAPQMLGSLGSMAGRNWQAGPMGGRGGMSVPGATMQGSGPMGGQQWQSGQMPSQMNTGIGGPGMAAPNQMETNGLGGMSAAVQPGMGAGPSTYGANSLMQRFNQRRGLLG